MSCPAIVVRGERGIAAAVDGVAGERRRMTGEAETTARGAANSATHGSVLLVALALVLGALSLWELTEQDIFWQIRAGDELLRSWRFPDEDTWSFAARGEPWMNLQWLATILFRAVFVFGPAGLVLARGMIVALLFVALGRLVRSQAGDAPPWFTEATLLPLVWLTIAFRLQLRSDTLVFVLFAGVLWWCYARPQHPRAPWVYVGAVILAANLHPGTSPFVMMIAGYAIATTDAPWRRRLTLIAALVPANFVTPYHLHVLPFLYRHFFYFDGQVLKNPDHQRLDPSIHFDPGQFGVAGLVWLGLSLLGVAGIALTLRRDRREGLLAAIVAAGLTWMCVERIRAFPYQVIFLLPFATRALAAVHAKMARIPRAPAVVSTAAALGLLAYQAATTPRTLGLRESRAMYPIDSVRFILANGIRPNLYHTFAYGAYIVWYLRQLPDFVDPRETPFRKLEKDYLAAYSSPEHARRLYERYDVNAVLVPVPVPVLVPGLGYRDLIEEWLPRDRWALVYWDDLSVLVVRRIPEHAGVIADHEYRYLRPNLPPSNFLAGGLVRTEDEILAYSREVKRCLDERPHDELCRSARKVVAELGSALRDAKNSP